MVTWVGPGTFSESAACGLSLRSEDPEAMRDFILRLQRRAASVQEEAAEKVPKSSGSVPEGSVKVPEGVGAGSENGRTGLSTRVWGRSRRGSYRL